ATWTRRAGRWRYGEARPRGLGNRLSGACRARRNTDAADPWFSNKPRSTRPKVVGQAFSGFAEHESHRVLVAGETKRGDVLSVRAGGAGSAPSPCARYELHVWSLRGARCRPVVGVHQSRSR